MKEDHHEILPLPSNRNSKSKKQHRKQHTNIKVNLNPVFSPNLADKESIENTSSIPTATQTDQSAVEINTAQLSSDDIQVSDNSIVVQHPEESDKASPISEAFDFDEHQTSLESYIASLNQQISSSLTPSVATTPLSTTPSSSTTTATDGAAFLSSATSDGATTPEINSIKLELLTKQLRESVFQVLHSSDIDPNHKELRAALVKIVTEEFGSLHEDTGLVVKLFSKKVKLLLLCCLLGMFVVSVGFFLFSDVQCSFEGPSPT